jgi:hypothetical protein
MRTIRSRWPRLPRIIHGLSGTGECDTRANTAFVHGTALDLFCLQKSLCYLLLPMLQLHAAQGTIRQVRFSFQRASGEPGSVTITPTHLVMRLTAAGTLVGSQSTRVDACKP